MKGTNIGFVNPNNTQFYDTMNDEVQFDVRSDELHELALLWFDFCKDEGIITYVDEVEVDD